MIEALNFLRGAQIDTLSVSVRLVLAVICGGLIGLERERKRRPAGFRTHILICLGAAMTTLTSQFLVLNMGLYTDMARLGAQVIAGVGFIGAGTIIITKRRQVKGLTTAAGLWASAIVGLCCGAAFFEGAVITTLLILVSELVLAKLEYFIMSSAATFNLYIEYKSSENLASIIDQIKSKGCYIMDMEISKNGGEESVHSVTFSIRSPRRVSHQAMMTIIAKLDGVTAVEEL